MELLLKLLQDTEINESLRIVAEQCEKNQIMLGTNRALIYLLFAWTVFLAGLFLWTTSGLEKKLQKFKKNC